MKTKLTELLGIKYPVIQGGMAWTSDAVLAAAVSNAGGAGIIGSGGRTVEWTRDEVRKAKSLTDKPFGVNVMLMAPNIAEIIAMLCEEKVAFVTLGAGNPVPHIPAFHAAGIKVIPVVPNVKLAKRIEAAGADAMVIDLGVRCLANAFTDAYTAREIAGAPKEELMAMGTGTNRKGIVEGDIVNGTVMCGQSLNVLNDILPCKDVMERIIAEAKEAIANVQKIEL